MNILLSLALLLGQNVIAGPILPVPSPQELAELANCVVDTQTDTWYFFANDDTIGSGQTCHEAHLDADKLESVYVKHVMYKI